MRWNEIGDSLCPIARALSVVGDRWTLLILRELSMGVHRFEEMQAQTGMSSHLLSTRLQRLSRAGILDWRIYSSRPTRHEYHATQKGRELDAVLLTLQIWGCRWGEYDAQEQPAVRVLSASTGEEITTFWQSPKGDAPFTYEMTQTVMSDAFKAEREARQAAFLLNRYASRVAQRL